MTFYIHKVKVRQTLILLSALLLFFGNGNAQIYFKNPSFEGTPPLPIYHTPIGWSNYISPPAILPDSTYYGDRAYKKAYNGLYYVAFDGANVTHTNDTIGDGLSQTLSCYLKKNVAYSFSFYGIGIIEFSPHNYRKGGGVRVWLADDYLNKVQLIYRAFPLDTNWWQKCDVSFIPISSVKNIIIEGYQPPNDCVYKYESGIDYLSPITFNSKDYLKATISDTLITTYKSVQLICSAVDSATYTWSSVPMGFTSTEQNPVANPTQTTTYIVTATFTCGLQVSDTVKVRVNISKPPPAPYIQTYITNNGNWHIQNENVPVSVKIYDALGQILYTDNNYQNTFNPAQAGLAVGVYFYVIDYNSGNEIRGKLVVVR